MTRKCLILLNPISGTRSKKNLVPVIEETFRKHNLAFEITHTNCDDDYAYLPKKIQQEQFTDLVLCGGDGTISTVLAYLTNTSIPIGIIPMGSGNGLAMGAGLPMNTRAAIERIVTGTATPTDGIRINDRFCCMLSGLGLDAQVAHDFAKEKKRGLLRYIKLTTRHFWKGRSYPMAITINGETIEADVLFISIANSNQFGNRVTIAPKALLNDGKMDVVIVKKQLRLIAAWQLLRQIVRGKVMPGNTSTQKTVCYFQTTHLEIHNPSNAPFHIDGEPMPTAEHFKVDIIPNAFRLIR
ncbi:MAG: diacylglycerol/lipid kinase family protein [Ferruginibacter sp.]